MLASDAQNQEFVGAHNPDDRLFVEFYIHEPEDPNKSRETGKRVRGEATPYIRIQVPGDKTTVIETPVREDHKRRWPQKWLYFQMKEGLIAGDMQVPGWSIDEWDYLAEDQKRELKYMRFTVVEQIAGASDAQLQKIGMGALAMRDAARKALRDKMGAEVREAMEAKDREIAQLKLAQAEADRNAKAQEERLARLEEALLAKPDPAQPVVAEKPVVTAENPPKKRGRPRKNPELAVVSGG